jgi:peptidoglycan hydrolase-like protein with peptidoglycan-binding domain
MATVYDSLLDVPLDEQDPADDGDDSVIPEETPHDAPLKLAAPFSIIDHAIAVPFIAAKPGDRGKHIRALNRALSKAGFRRWQVFSTVWPRQIPGKVNWLTRAVRRFQQAHGVPVTGVYDRATHDKLAHYYDAYAIKYLLMAPVPQPTKDDHERAAFVAQLMYLYNRRYTIPYTQRRPGSCSTPPTGADCSFSGEWAGTHCTIGSLSGYPGCGYGNTDSQLARFRTLKRIRASIATAKPGDPKYYGTSLWNPTHVSYFLGRSDGVARVWSFGSFPIKILDADYRHDGVAVCNLTGRT